jgi:hypothetical protein
VVVVALRMGRGLGWVGGAGWVGQLDGARGAPSCAAEPPLALPGPLLHPAAAQPQLPPRPAHAPLSRPPPPLPRRCPTSRRPTPPPLRPGPLPGRALVRMSRWPPASARSCTLMTRCTIGMSRPSRLNTTISPVRAGALPRLRKRMSPRWKPGSMLPLSTTTTGDSLPVTSMSVFQITSADVTTRPARAGKAARGRCGRDRRSGGRCSVAAAAAAAAARAPLRSRCARGAAPWGPSRPRPAFDRRPAALDHPHARPRAPRTEVHDLGDHLPLVHVLERRHHAAHLLLDPLHGDRSRGRGRCCRAPAAGGRVGWGRGWGGVGRVGGVCGVMGMRGKWRRGVGWRLETAAGARRSLRARCVGAAAEAPRRALLPRQPSAAPPLAGSAGTAPLAERARRARPGPKGWGRAGGGWASGGRGGGGPPRAGAPLRRRRSPAAPQWHFLGPPAARRDRDGAVKTSPTPVRRPDQPSRHGGPRGRRRGATLLGARWW